MKQWLVKELPNLPKMKLAVVGHTEWIRFLKADKIPGSGEISHAERYLEVPAGGGAVAAIKLAKIQRQPVDFFTALGKDRLGKICYEQLQKMGLRVHIAWKDKPTREGISMIDSYGDRAITVIGERIQPCASDKLPWQELCNYDGIFVTATDSEGLNCCRKAKVLVATPRVSIATINNSGIELDALIGSGLDPDENLEGVSINPNPKIKISTSGALGGECWPNGFYKAVKPNKPEIDSYGCGDTFAACVTAGLAAGWDIEKAISLGCHYGSLNVTHFGPYDVSQLRNLY